MSIPIRAGEDEKPFQSLGWTETILFLLFTIAAACIIGALTFATWLARAIVSIAEDPHAGPYRQVR